MTNRHWQPDELRDVEAINYRASQAGLAPAELSRRLDAIGRDNARTPMQWDAGPTPDSAPPRPGLPSTPTTSR